MSNTMKIILVVILGLGILTQDKICEHLGFGQVKHHEEVIESTLLDETATLADTLTAPTPVTTDYYVNDSLYHWDQEVLNWVTVGLIPDYVAQLTTHQSQAPRTQDPITIQWEVLMDIEYRLKFYKEMGMEMYAPVFSKALKALDGQEVIIEGFVIPFDEEGELLSLSYNPYASCFFCGKASPASIISMYLRDPGKRYKMDDFKTFRGTLHLNHDDPNEFYYILRDAREN